MTIYHEEIYRRQIDWAQRMVAEIRDYTTGVPRQHFVFDDVWQRALKTCQRRCPGESPRDDQEAVPFAEFFRRACEREWYGWERCDFAGLVGSLVPESDPVPRLTVPVPA